MHDFFRNHDSVGTATANAKAVGRARCDLAKKYLVKIVGYL